MKLKDALIGWNPPKRCSPERDEVPGAVGVWHFKDSLIRRDCGDAELPWEKFCSTSGACDFDRAKMAPWQRLALLFIDFHTAVVRDGIDPQVMHQAFLNIDEYRVRIAPDIQGAE